MKKVRVKGGYWAKVDDKDYEEMRKFNWFFMKGYAVRNHPQSLMHRAILKARKGVNIDHINGDGLDNRRENLRFCRPFENQRNSRKRKAMSSQYKGVSWKSSHNTWRATINVHRKHLHIGYFRTERQAAMAYDIAAKDLFGEFAHTNF